MNNNIFRTEPLITPPNPTVVPSQVLKNTSTTSFPQQNLLPPPPPPQPIPTQPIPEQQGFWFNPMISKEAVAGAPDWLRPTAEFATELTTPFDVALTAGTALFGGPAAFALRGGVSAALGARKVNLARRGLANIVDPIRMFGMGGARGSLPARVIGETGLTAGGHALYKVGEERGGIAGGIVAAFGGGVLGGAAGLGLAKGMGKALQKAPITRTWFEHPLTKSRRHFDPNDPTQFRETPEPVYTENLEDMKNSLHDIEAEITQGLIKHTKNELADSWIGRSIDRLPTGVQEFMHSFGRVFNPINHVRKLEHAATIGIFRGEELVKRNTEKLMDFVRINEMPKIFGATEKTLDITDIKSLNKFSFITDGPLMTAEKRRLIRSKGKNPDMISVSQILEESPNPMRDQFAEWETILDADQKAMLKRIQQVNEYTRSEMARFLLPDEGDPTRRKPKKRVFGKDDSEPLDVLTYTKEELLQIAKDSGLKGDQPGGALHDFRDNVIGYANRKFVVKLNPDDLTADVAVIGKDGGAWQIGQRVGSEAQRKLTRINLANLEGYRYASLDDALRMSTRSRLGRAMTRSHSRWLVKEVRAGNLDKAISVTSKRARQYELLLRDKGIKNKLPITEQEIKDILDKYNNGDFSVQPAVLAQIQGLESMLKSTETILNKIKIGKKLTPDDLQALRQISKSSDEVAVDISDVYHDKTGEQVIKRLRESQEEGITQLETWKSILEALPNFKGIEDMEFAITLAWARRLMGDENINNIFVKIPKGTSLEGIVKRSAERAGFSLENMPTEVRLEMITGMHYYELPAQDKLTIKNLLKNRIDDYKKNLNNEIDTEINALATELRDITANSIRWMDEVIGDVERLLSVSERAELDALFLNKYNELESRVIYLEHLKLMYRNSGSPKNLDFDNQDYIKGMSYGVNGFGATDIYQRPLPAVMDSVFQLQKNQRLYPNMVGPDEPISKYLNILRGLIKESSDAYNVANNRLNNTLGGEMQGVLSDQDKSLLIEQINDLEVLLSHQTSELESIGTQLTEKGLTENNLFKEISVNPSFEELGYPKIDLDQLKHIENIIGEAWFKTFNPDYNSKNLELYLEKQNNKLFKNLITYEKLVSDAAEQDVIHGNEVVFKSPADLEDWIFRVSDDAPAGTFDRLIEFRDSFQKSIDRSEVTGMIKWWSQANALQRMVALGFDASIFNIHLLPVLFNHPEVNAIGAKGFVEAFYKTMKDKQAGDIFVQNYRAKLENVKIMGLYENQILMSESNEVFEILKNTALGEAFRSNKITGNLGASFENAFNHTLDIAGIELAKGLDHLVDVTADAATQSSQRKIIAEYVNSMRGLFSSGMLGINPNQSLWESIFLLAPRYRRAIGALFVQALQGDPLRRYLAQKALINTATGLALTTVLLQIAASAIGEDEPEELQAKLDRMLDPSTSDFLLFDMNGQKVGPGSKFVSDARILSKAMNFFYKAGTQEDMEEWENFVSLSEDNPGLRWVRSQLAYAPSTAWDFFTGADYMGDPAFRKGDSDIDTITNFVQPFTDMVTPLWLSSVAFDNTHGNLDWGDRVSGGATRGLSEFTGLRSYPQGAAAILREASFDIMNAPYANLEPFQKDILRHSLMEQLSPIQEQQVKRGKNDFAIYFNDVDRINKDFQSELIEMTAMYPNTPEGNRNMYDRYRQLKSYRRGQLHEIGYDVEFDEPELSDVKSKNTLNKYYKMFDSVRIAGTQLIDWDQWELEYEKLMSSLSLDQQLVIARNTSRLPIPYQFLERIKYLGEAREYKRIMKAQGLREEYFIAQGREDLASKSRDLYLMRED